MTASHASGHVTPPLLAIDRASLDLPAPDGDRLEVLREVSLTVRAGEFVSIIGPRGWGESTPLHIVRVRLDAAPGPGARQ